MVNMSARTRTALFVNLATIVERADEQVLPAVYKAIGLSLNASLSQLGALTTARALVQTFSSPLSGCLGDRFDRTQVIAWGCYLWGGCTALVGLATSLHQAMLFCAFNGLGLALVIPCSQSLIADYYHADQRGQAFGLMAFTGAMGGLMGGFFATNVSHATVLGIEGWRFAFLFVAAISFVVGAGVVRLAVDPRYQPAAGSGLKHKQSDMESLLPQVDQATAPSLKRPTSDPEFRPTSPGLLNRYPSGSSPPATPTPPPPHPPGSPSKRDPPSLRHPRRTLNAAALRARDTASGILREISTQTAQVWRDVRWLLGLRTFQIIVVQGIVGCFPWQAMVFFTLWLQLQGFSDFAASSLMATFAAGAALGGWLGGVIGDRMAKWRPNAGRIMTAQASVLSGLPLTWLLLKGLPASGLAHSAPAFAAVMFSLGLTCTWCGSGCNSPIFAEVVPVELRSTVYAFDRSFENAIASCAAPIVGLMAERVFHFQGTVASSAGQTPAAVAANAAALANSLAVCMLVPWSVCLLFFTGLYWVYPHDKFALSSSGMAAKRAAAVKAALVN